MRRSLHVVIGVLAVGEPPYPTPGLVGGLCDGFGFIRFVRWKVCLADLCEFRVELLCFNWKWERDLQRATIGIAAICLQLSADLQEPAGPGCLKTYRRHRRYIEMIRENPGRQSTSKAPLPKSKEHDGNDTRMSR